jgi:hypothetical protein
MQLIELNLREDFDFFCPITGEQIVFKDDFNPSKAMLFCYVDIANAFEHADDWTQNKFSINLDDPYLDLDTFHKVLKDEVDKGENSNFVCFSITTEGMACGPMSSTAYICIDMDYREDSDQAPVDPIIDNLPSIKSIRAIIKQAKVNKPMLEGYAACLTNTHGESEFYFIDDIKVWEEFMPTLIFFSDNYGEFSYEPFKNTNNFEDKTNIYYSYFEPFHKWTLKEYDEFMTFSNEILEDYSIEFIGPISELFNLENNFVKKMIVDFKNDPNENKEEYFKYLMSYQKK